MVIKKFYSVKLFHTEHSSSEVWNPLHANFTDAFPSNIAGLFPLLFHQDSDFLFQLFKRSAEGEQSDSQSLGLSDQLSRFDLIDSTHMTLINAF